MGLTVLLFFLLFVNDKTVDFILDSTVNNVFINDFVRNDDILVDIFLDDDALSEILDDCIDDLLYDMILSKISRSCFSFLVTILKT